LSHKDLTSQLLALVETPKDSLMLTKAIKSVEAELKRRAKHSGSDLQKSSAQMHMRLALGSTLIPHAIMIEICKLLTQSKLCLMARTSKAMVDLAFDPSLWRALKSVGPESPNQFKSREVNCKELLTILRHARFRSLQELWLPSGLKLGKTGLKSICELCPQLQRFQANARRKVHFKEGQLLQLAQTALNLQEVHFDMWEVKSGEVISFAQEMGSRLQVLKLNAMYHWFTVEAAEAIAKHCTSLQEISISGQKYGRSYSTYQYKEDVGIITRLLCNIASLKVLAVSTAASSMFDFSDPANLKSKSDGFIVPAGLKVVRTLYN